MKKLNKKAFTIVELIIVIVIIGILAAILIPNLVRYIDKAHVTKDMELVRNLNTSLTVDKAENGKHETMTDALEAAKKFGYLVGSINRSKVGNEILWDSENDVFCYFDGTEIKYIPEAPRVNEVEDSQYFVIKDVNSASDVHEKYGTYVRDLGEDVTEITTSNSLDVGEHTTLLKVNYVNNSTTAKKVSFRTNGGELTVNAYVAPDGSGDEITHYNYAESVDGQKLPNKSYHEKGTVPFVKVKTGHVVVEETGWVNAVHIEKATESSFNEIKVSVKSESVPKFSRDSIDIPANTEVKVCVVEVEQKTEAIYLTKQGIYEQIKVAEVVSGVEQAKAYIEGEATSSKINTVADQVSNNIGRTEDGFANITVDNVEYTVELNENRELVIKNATTGDAAEVEVATQATEAAVEDSGISANEAQNASVFEGTGTKEDPFLIYDWATFQAVTSMYESGFNYFKVKDGVTNIDCSKWLPVMMNGSLDGNGVTLTNVTATLFKTIGYAGDTVESIMNGDLYVKNLTAEMNVALDPDNPYSTGAMIKNVFNTGKTTLENITMHGVIEGYYNLGSFWQYGPTNAHDDYVAYEVVMKNCNSDVTLICATANSVGGLIGHPYSNQSAPCTLTITDCSYTGKAYLSGTATLNAISAIYNNCFSTINGEVPTYDSKSANYLNTPLVGQYSYITQVNPTKAENGYFIAKQGETKKIIVSICVQLTSYDENGIQIPAASGITSVRRIAVLQDISGDSVKVFDTFSSVELVFGEGVSSVVDGVLKLYVGEGSEKLSGTVTIQVNQYKANGEYVAAGRLQVASCTVATNDTFHDQPWIVK